MMPRAIVMQLISSLQVGGAEKLLLSLLDSARGCKDVHYVIVVMNTDVNDELARELENSGYDVYFLNRPEGSRNPFYLFSLLWIAMKHEVRIIHSHNRGSTAWAMLCKVFLPYLKVVMTVHDTPNLRILGPLRLRLHRYFVDMNIAISDAVARECKKYEIPKYTRIYNGIWLKQFSGKNGLSPKPPVTLINVARMDYLKKGQDVLIKAVRLCRKHGLNVNCMLVGGVYDYNLEQFEYLKALVRDYSLEEHVVFVVNRTDVPELLKKADVFVLPSRYEGFGLVVLEAMASGLPVICSNIDGPSELVKDGYTGYLFSVGDEQSLFEKIKAVYNNPVHAGLLAENALEYVQQFDISRMRDAYHCLYAEMLWTRQKFDNTQNEWRFQNEPSV